MMKNKQTYKNVLGAFALATLMLTGSGCTDQFEKWNTNPDQATEEMMERDNLASGAFFVQMQNGVFIVGVDKGAEYQITQNLAGDIFSGYMGNIGVYSYATYHNSHYLLYKGWYDAAFNRAYVDIMQPWYAIKKNSEETSPAAYAVATIVKVLGMSRITDMYGPIPYTTFGGSLKAAYDSQEVVYDTFFKELESSITLLTDFYNQNPNMKVLAKYDNIYSGNLSKWIKFANTLRLRLAMRISYANPTKARTEAEAAVNHVLGLIKTADAAAYLRQTTQLSYKNPLWEISESFDDVRMGASIDCYMNGFNDPRLSAYFKGATDGGYHGVRNGIYISSKNNYLEKVSRLNFATGDNMLWMSAAESYFLCAEGALKGWNMGGTAASFYEDGIRTSFAERGVSGADAYIQDETSKPISFSDMVSYASTYSPPSTITIKWNESSNNAMKLERIMLQKWIALYPDGQEAWSEFRRTGYPKLVPVYLNQSAGEIDTDIQIRRLKFPSTEYDNNLVNVKQAASLLGGADTGGTKLWWDAK